MLHMWLSAKDKTNVKKSKKNNNGRRIDIR